MGYCTQTVVEPNALAYLGGQLEDHYEAAMDAFCRIFRLNEYKTEGKDHVAEAAAAPPPNAGARRALRKLIDEWDAEAGDSGGAPSR